MSDIIKFEPSKEPEPTKEDFVPGTLENPKAWGIFDMKTKLWMGTSTYPLTFGHWIAAQVIAQTLSEQLEVPIGRHMAKPFNGAEIKVDDISTKISFEEALKRACGNMDLQQQIESLETIKGKTIREVARYSDFIVLYFTDDTEAVVDNNLEVRVSKTGIFES
jgi:hypothetical protein